MLLNFCFRDIVRCLFLRSVAMNVREVFNLLDVFPASFTLISVRFLCDDFDERLDEPIVYMYYTT